MTHMASLDHLVVAAATLEDGVHWCEATLGVTPLPGGVHPLFGTHNRLLPLASPVHPLSYFEIIAIDPSAPSEPQRRAPRWFDLDAPNMQLQLTRQGPQLIHWVARVSDIHAALAAWDCLGISRGQIIEASRPTSNGVLRWKISVREDGQRLFDGALPTLIEWGTDHPRSGMTGPAFSLEALSLSHPQYDLLSKAFDAVGIENVLLQKGPAEIQAVLVAPDRSRIDLYHRPDLTE
jgi:hypothetical protein